MKKLFVIGAFACAALSANASYMYWQVDTGLEQVQAWAETSGKNWDKALLHVRDASGKNVVNVELANLDINEDGYQGRTGVTAVNLESITSLSGYSYYIELVNSTPSSTTQIGFQKGTYADLAQSVTVYTDALPIDSIPQASVWHGSSSGYRATPEPTSAVLMLLGVAGLALRRKQRKLA